ncbi:protein FAM110A-like [Seriola lalandi dorsalis]|uniref:protein FAM110A-like n=1 Tax=Seriola lalandi dorsalis TaxID=1841481 RepID=UPI000C6F5031|nr:protein FAM110A-like [Seriola lalandi dorsalis]XP_023260834.1 protein FAM110A-like [Seriola lalandi dorsalis]XP_056241120.1 protein FAM110A [Seriola aureovittata]XP_056241121.1 protein FAM110A [Seriola aureovittata]XP_056241122.1 protein FAM110A [Seriola aureovittata]
MPVETFQHPVRQPARTTEAATPPRLRPKGPVGPDFYRQCPTAESRPKQSAVERLEADKAKYVKSQVALSKQRPLRPPEVRKPLLSPAAALRPTRKTPTQTKTKQEGVQLDLEHLSNLISNVSDGPQSSTTVSSEDSKDPVCAATAHSSPRPTPVGAQEKKERLCPPPCPDWSSPAKVRLKASGPIENPGSPGSLAAGTVRRVDVMPQASHVRTTCRRPQFIRQPLRPIPFHSQFPLRPAASHLRLFHPRTTPGSSPLKPVVAPFKPDNPPSSPAGSPVPAPPPPSFPVFPPPSPAITRLSSSSSRKRPSLTRSKSDMSDRYSRAGTELERFFNLCGLDPADLQDLTGSSSDIVSLARFRSVSAPGSECAGSGREDEEDEEEDAGNIAERVPYGVSVIERNARVIKWLYGLRQTKDNATKSTNL